MRIGPFRINRVRKTKTGLKIYPWQALTEDRVSPELRQVVAKVARSEVKSYLEGLEERVREDDRLLAFVNMELDRMATRHFFLDADTFDKLLRLLDRLREQESA